MQGHKVNGNGCYPACPSLIGRNSAEESEIWNFYIWNLNLDHKIIFNNREIAFRPHAKRKQNITD